MDGLRTRKAIPEIVDDYILISQLNDFIFCPYSIYLHNVYMDTDESLYHAVPQTQGRIVHEAVDNKTSSHSKNDIFALPVYSEEFGLMGKIDVYKTDTKTLIERKYQLKQIYQGQIYQLWAQYFCMIEMGHTIDNLGFYEISTNRTIKIELPNIQDKEDFRGFIQTFKEYDPSVQLIVNPNKCSHCIYCNLCDKTEKENVY